MFVAIRIPNASDMLNIRSPGYKTLLIIVSCIVVL